MKYTIIDGSLNNNGISKTIINIVLETFSDKEYIECSETADIVIFISPEHNGSYSAFLKQQIDSLPYKMLSNKIAIIITYSSDGTKGKRASDDVALMAFRNRMIVCPTVINLDNKDHELSDLKERLRLINSNMEKIIKNW